METAKLKNFAQFARRSLMEQISAKLKQVLADNSPARRENTKAISQLEKAIKKYGKEQVIERVAYTWFNRFCALRFMDVNRYTRIGVVSPAEGQFQPEILAEAKMGHIDENMVSDKLRQQVFALLDGKSSSHDPQGEAYRLLLVAACNFWHRAMSFLFEHINDYTELLMPDDLLSGNSILAYTREALTPDVCEGVEVIGWLYQFYISEKKDAVFAGLKKNKKITPENIPAATQLFTPHWIVRYLVENSLGRLWMLNRPHSRLIEKMEYYIKPELPETDFLRITKPEEIKFCDPACGSGHILAYAFDLFYAMYEEEGYEPAEIPWKILTHNLYGIEIDERAGALAAFALTMKARTRHRRFFRKPVEPNICVLKNVQFDDKEINEYMDFIGRDLFTTPLQTTLRQFEEADNFGSLIRPDVTDVAGLLKMLESKNIEEHMFLSQPHQKVLEVLRQADFFNPKYHVVAANPPYMGKKGMNGRLAAWAKDNYPESKFDLFAMFIEGNIELTRQQGYVAMITMQSWMFLSSYGRLRNKIINNIHMPQMFHTGPGVFPDLGAFNVLTTNFILLKCRPKERNSLFIKANETPEWQTKITALKKNNNQFSLPLSRLSLVPDSPFVYWLGENAIELFVKFKLIRDVCPPRVGLQTGDNEKFVRYWHEVSLHKFFKGCKNKQEATEKKWFPYNKGGNYRKWYGNNDCVVNWENNGSEIRNFKDEKGKLRSRPQNLEFYFKSGIVYSLFGFENFGVRYKEHGFIFDVSGSSMFPNTDLEIVLAYLCSNVAFYFLKALAPTVNFQVGDLARLPLPNLHSESKEIVKKLVNSNIKIVKNEWDSHEYSWNFSSLPLLSQLFTKISEAIAELQKFQQNQKEFLRHNEERINEILIENYQVHSLVDSKVLDRDLSIDIMSPKQIVEDLIHYAVGCMFGRFALDKPGLILANQGETIEDYLKQIPEPGFTPNEDNVIPLLNGDWFSDDITVGFKQFLRVTFGEDHYEENLRFIEQGLNIKGKRSFTIRDYFLKEFYNDHVRRYKKRPIYWLFSSPKGSFNALIYMHRYQPYTASTVLSYLRDFKNEKLRAHKEQLEAVSISADASKSEKARALKEIEKVNKIITELETYERDILYPLATKQVEIDLDDGVKVNYPKFGAALKKVPGLSGAKK